MRPKGERLEPLGASDEETFSKTSECERCTRLEDEKEMLQTSLFALTTHFAQVQFRLRQICDSPFEDQEDRLKSLEEFAFTDINLLGGTVLDDDIMEAVKSRRNEQKLLLNKLKCQLKELRKFEVGVTKAKIVWDQLFEHLRAKESLEMQLRTQIVDLERFIEYLRSVSGKCACKQSKKTFRSYVIEILEQGFSFLQMFALIQFNWGTSCFTVKAGINHWGDLRAKLELAIINLRKMLHSKEDPKRITVAVRRGLAVSIRDLMQHGTKSCNFLVSSSTHCWDIILFYYYFRKGDEFNSSAVQKLSRSFSVEIAGVSPKTNKTNLFCAIEEIILTYSRYKRSNDSHFKALICAGLNARSLVVWLNLIFHCKDVIDTFYYPWSYVATTRYQDGLRSLDLLTKYKFDLPVDLDVQKFKIKDNVSFYL